MNSQRIFLFFLLSIAIHCICYGNASTSNTESYSFVGVEVSKSYKKAFYPVVSAEKKKVIVQTDKGKKRVRYGAKGVAVRRQEVTTSLFAQIISFNYEFENKAAQLRASRANVALEIGADMAQAELDTSMTATERGSNAGTQPKLNDFEQSERKTTIDNSSSLIEKPIQIEPRSQVADTIYLNLELRTNVSLENVYGLVAYYYDKIDRNGKIMGGKNTIFSLERFGNLKSEVPESVSISINTREQLLSGSKFHFYLFSGDGTPIATNVSSNLKSVSTVK